MGLFKCPCTDRLFYYYSINNENLLIQLARICFLQFVVLLTRRIIVSCVMNFDDNDILAIWTANS